MRKLAGLALLLGLFTSPLTPAAAATSPDMDTLRSILVPADQQLPFGTLNEPMRLADAGDMKAPPPGMDFRPLSCYSFNFDGLGDVETFDGWMQIGSRLDEARGEVYFIQMVAVVPGGPDLRAIKKAAHTCRSGTLTLEGRITGRITYRDQRPPHLESATAYVTRMTVDFPDTRNEEEAALLTKYHFSSGSCPAEYVFVAIGDVLLWSLDPDAEAAVRAARIMYDRARAVLS